MKVRFVTLLALAIASTAQAKLSDRVIGGFDRIANHFKHIIETAKDRTQKIVDHMDKQADKIVEKVDDYVTKHEDEIDSWAEALKNLPDSIKDVRENTGVAVDFFDHQADLNDLTFLPVKNSTCITLHCSGYIAACLADGTCREQLQCAGQCPKGDTACTVTCSLSYPSSRLDTLFQCLYVDHECLSLPPPDPINNATCRDPPAAVEQVEDAQLSGTWYVVQGFNPLYDCYACQKLSFEVTDGQIDYSTIFSLIAANQTQIWQTAQMKGEDRSQPGHLLLSGTDNGLPDSQDWQVMHLSDDTMVVYYCGDILDQWHFEGMLVMSRTTELNAERQADVDQIMAELGITADQMCLLSPDDACSAAPLSSPDFNQ